MATMMTGATTTGNMSADAMVSGLVRAGKRRKRKGDTEDAADARMPGDAAEDGGAHFIAGAIKHPGSLHAALGVPQGQRIPRSKITAAARSGSANLRRKAQFALTLEGMNHKRK